MATNATLRTRRLSVTGSASGLHMLLGPVLCSTCSLHRVGPWDGPTSVTAAFRGLRGRERRTYQPRARKGQQNRTRKVAKKKKKILGGSNTRPLDYLRDTWITILPFCHLKKLKNLSIRSPSLGFRVRVTNPRPVSFDHGSRSLDDQWPRVGTKWQLLLLDRRASWRWPPTIRSSSAEKRSTTMCGHDNTLRQVRTSSEGAWQKP